MRTLSCLISMLIGACVLARAEQGTTAKVSAPDDDYSVAFVTSALDFMKRGGGSSFEMKQFWPLNQLGDGVSIAVLKIYDKNDLVKTENASAYLIVVRNAFSNRSQVLHKSDLEPRVTQFVLDYLEEKEAANPVIQKRIAYVKGCIKDFTCSSQGEYNYFNNR